MNVSFFLDAWMAGLARACWQGGLILLLIWALCRALPCLSPRVRCWLWRLAYLKLLLALFVGGAGTLDLPLLPAPRPASPVPAGTFVTPAAHARPVPLPATSFPDAVPAASAVSVVPVGPAPEVPPLFALFVLWACGVGWFGCRLARQQREMIRLRRSYAPLEDAAWTDCCVRLCRRLGLRRAPLLLIAATHDDLNGPLLTGVRHPAVVLPSTLTAECSPADMRLILAHELAHLRRRDLSWNWLPALAQTLFFFHPLVWVAGREWRLAQEMAADEKALLVTEAPVEDYGALLVRVAARTGSPYSAGSLIALRIVDSPRTLKRRLIAMTTFVPVSRVRRRVTAAALLLGAAAGLLPWRAVAQQQTPPAAPIVPVLAPPPPAAVVAPIKGTKAVVKAVRPVAVPPKKQPAAPVLPVPVVAPAAPVNAPAVPLVAPPARLVPATRPVIAAAPPLLVPAAATAAPSAVPPPVPAASVVPLGSSAPPAPAPQAPVPPPDATRQDDSGVGKVIGEQIAARMEAFGEQIGPQMEAKGREIGALAEQLSHSDLSDERRADLTRRITVLGQEMAGLVVPLVRESLRVAMPEIRRQTELGVTTGKISPAQIRAELDRALTDVKRDTGGTGLSLAQRSEIEQLIREVRQEVEEGIRAGMAARDKTPGRAAPPAPKDKIP